MKFPLLRAIEATPIQHEGQTVIMVRDPEGLCEQSLAVPPMVFLVMTLLDGRHDVAAMREALSRAGGGLLLTTEKIRDIVSDLDSFYLLENETAAARRMELNAAYEAMATRPATHAGSAYPAEAAACRQMLDGLFERHPKAAADAPRPRGLIVPHIDLRIGGDCLAAGLSRLDPARPPRLVIILGVAHAPAKNLFTLTDKSFETPLGLVQTDPQAVALMREWYGSARLDHARVHLGEHSVEFPALALKYLYGEGAPLSILPILCSALHEELTPDGPPPAERAEVGEFIAALGRLIAHYEGDVCLIASVDLSHVGLKFGDEQGVDDLRAQAVGAADEQMLGLIEAMNPEAFFDHFRADANARHVDAVAATYVLMHVLGQGRVERIDYRQWREAATDSMVTYAAQAIY